MVVDETRMMAVVRGSYWMRVTGAEEVVENDTLWVLVMEGDGGRVRRSVEFMDGVSMGRARVLMEELKGKDEGGILEV